MTTWRYIRGHEQAKCYTIHEDNGDLYLISYTTTVLECRYIGNNKWDITCNGLYSMTTRKHIGWFIRQYFTGITYNDIKLIAGGYGTVIAYGNCL